MSSDQVGSSIFGRDASSRRSIEEKVDLTNFKIFNRAVVIETLCDPSIRNVQNDIEIVRSLRNAVDYLSAPRNSIICRIINNGEGQVDAKNNYVCFPFFSSHLMMPVKAGEQVWIFFENSDLKNSRPFWISRISEPIFVEDANFTHGDRREQKTHKSITANNSSDDGSGNFSNPRKLKFQNGNPLVTSNATLDGKQDAFLNVIKNSSEYSNTAFEPVPRVTKRPGDLVLQGSNNTSIRLGTSMGWSSKNRPENKPESFSIASVPKKKIPEPLESGLGTIDIVTGRGKIYQQLNSENDQSKQSKKNGISPSKSTRPIIEENELGRFETDKNIQTQQEAEVANSKGNNASNPYEGDPDFLLDDSRILLTSKCEIDKDFGSGAEGTATAFENAVQSFSGPAIAVKSDHVRIIARKSKLQRNSSAEPSDISNQNPASNGSIRIIKEGEKNSDLASIVLEPDGTIQVSGSKIFLGRKTGADGGVGTGPGPGDSQPYVRYKQLEDLLNKTFDDLATFVQKLQANFSTNTTPGFGGPNPALIKSAADECTQFLSAIKKRKNEIATLKSKRIFGE